jgi:sporulation protein YlmC with PRC-barrel domain
MLHRSRELIGDRIMATDGEIGQVDNLFFDDERWGLRYFVVNTGSWLRGRRVLISPESVDASRSTEKSLRVNLSRKQVEGSPDVDTQKPVSRQYEEIFAKYYGFPLYWAPPEAAAMPLPGRTAEAERELKRAERKVGESHLRSSDEVRGYAIEARDGTVGHVEDILVDDEGWSVADLVVDTKNWLPGKEVLIPPSAVKDIDWMGRQVRLRMRRKDIESRPAAP